MAGFLNAVSAVFVIFLLMCVGYLLGHLGWMTASEKKFVSKFVINVAVPVNCVVGVLNNFTRDDLLGAGWQLLCAWLVVGVSLLLSAGVATLLKLPKNRWGVFVCMGGISNTMFIGMHMEAAELLGINPITVFAGQNSGASLGNLICPNNTVAACATVSEVGNENLVMRKTLVAYAIILVLYMVLATAYTLVLFPNFGM